MTPAIKQKAIRQITIPTKIAYGLGQTLSTVKDSLFVFFFLFFFSNLLGLSESLIVLSTSIALLFDAVSDPLMGQISDNYRSKKWGRRHAFMVHSIIPTGLALILLFSPPSGLGQWGLFAWATTFGILVRLALTVYRVPYYSLGAELSTDYNERTNISSIRQILDGILNISLLAIGFVVFLPDTPEFEDGMLNQAGYTPLVTTMVVVSGIGAFIATFGTRHRIPDLAKNSDDNIQPWTATFTELLRALKLKSFRVVTWAYSGMIILFGVSGSLSVYYSVYLWQLTQVQKSGIALVPIFVLLPATILASVCAAKWDKREACLLFAAVFASGHVAPFLGFMLGIMPPIGDDKLFLIVAGSNALAAAGFIGILILSFSMVADIADEFQILTSKRQEGILFSAFSFVQKLTYSVGVGVSGVVLAVISFPKQSSPSEVPMEVINNLAMAGLIVAGTLGLFTFLMFSQYPLNRQKLQEIQSKLTSM